MAYRCVAHELNQLVRGAAVGGLGKECSKKCQNTPFTFSIILYACLCSLLE